MDSLLTGGTEFTDTFESFNVGVVSAVALDSGRLNSISIVNGQGPGLVNAGVPYTAIGTNAVLQWDGANYYSSPSQEILANATTLAITYSTAVDAMGVDVRAFSGYGQSYTANVWSGANLVGTFSGTLDNGGTPQFFAWYNAGEIT